MHNFLKLVFSFFLKTLSADLSNRWYNLILVCNYSIFIHHCDDWIDYFVFLVIYPTYLEGYSTLVSRIQSDSLKICWNLAGIHFDPHRTRIKTLSVDLYINWDWLTYFIIFARICECYFSGTISNLVPTKNIDN